MNESGFTRQLMPKLRAVVEKQLGGVVFKHNDFYTAGVPDLTITLGRATTWFEIKVAPNTATKLQMYYLSKLKRSYLVVKHKEFYTLSFEKYYSLDELVIAMVAKSKEEYVTAE